MLLTYDGHPSILNSSPKRDVVGKRGEQIANTSGERTASDWRTFTREYIRYGLRTGGITRH